MEIGRDTVVKLRYRLSDEDGEVLEDAMAGEPVAVLQGHRNIIYGLDKALLGHRAGDVFDVTVSPIEGYGLRQEDQIQRVSKKYFANARKLKPGMQTHLRLESETRLVTVHKVGGKVIDVDMNHPLAGKTLHFHVEIYEVREATAVEIAHKHAHADGHHH